MNGSAKLRIIVFSDTHRSFNTMQQIFEQNSNADLFIFLGDGIKELIDIKALYSHKKVIGVAGNCDILSFAPGMGVTEVEGKKIMYLHGHSHGVKAGTGGIVRLAKENNADILLFGHTHQRFYSYIDGIHFLNPGSAAFPRDGQEPSYAYITEAGIVCNHVDLN